MRLIQNSTDNFSSAECTHIPELGHLFANNYASILLLSVTFFSVKRVRGCIYDLFIFHVNFSVYCDDHGDL